VNKTLTIGGGAGDVIFGGNGTFTGGAVCTGYKMNQNQNARIYKTNDGKMKYVRGRGRRRRTRRR